MSSMSSDPCIGYENCLDVKDMLRLFLDILDSPSYYIPMGLNQPAFALKMCGNPYHHHPPVGENSRETYLSVGVKWDKRVAVHPCGGEVKPCTDRCC